MCGIVGVVGIGAAPQRQEVDRLLATILHRGPDARGEWWGEGRSTWFGFRRLAILDLDQRSAQPMVDEATGVAMVFNGEIYNYVELRAQLEAKGHLFITTGDTEVLLRGYIEWRAAVFERCNGMFAVAISDPDRPGVLLARDRFGEKPLFVGRAAAGRGWWFGSEVATLCEAGVGRRRLDLVRTLGLLALGDIEDPTRSFVDGITPVAPGTSVRITPDGPCEERRWWSSIDVLRRGLDGPTPTTDEVREALDRSVALRLRSDVPVGTSLSGGVDSSAIVTSLRAVDPSRDLHTFTASFPGEAIDEWDRAALVGERAGVVMHRVEPTLVGFLADLDDLVRHQGAPIESPTVYAQWCVMRAANEAGVTVLLDGQGADESWGGYLKYLWFGVVGDMLSGRPQRSWSTVQHWRSLGSVPRPPILQVLGLAVPGQLRDPLTWGLVTSRRRNLGPAFEGILAVDPQGGARRGPLLSRAAATDVTRVILPRLLRYADRNSMAWSRELRLPFLDPDLYELAARSDWAAGIRSGWTKHLLREAVAPRVPAAIVWRREKTAYETPDRVWASDPRVRAALADAVDVLRRHGIVSGSGPETGSLDPWRLLSLASLVVQYGLTP